MTSHTGHGCHLPRGEEAAGEGPGPGEAALRPGLLLLAFWKLEGEGAVDVLHTTAGDSWGQLGTAGDSRGQPGREGGGCARRIWAAGA